MLALISMVTGIAGGSLALLQARQQPDKAKQMYIVSAVAFGMAALMLVMFVL